MAAAPCSHKNPGSKSLLKRLKNSAPNPLLPQTKTSAYSPRPRLKSSGSLAPSTVRLRNPEPHSFPSQVQESRPNLPSLSSGSGPPVPIPSDLQSGSQPLLQHQSLDSQRPPLSDPGFWVPAPFSLRPRSSDPQPLPPLDPESRSPAPSSLGVSCPGPCPFLFQTQKSQH